jgi:hypothetical protein
MRGEERERDLSQWVPVRQYIGAQMNFGDLTPYLTYGDSEWRSKEGEGEGTGWLDSLFPPSGSKRLAGIKL